MRKPVTPDPTRLSPRDHFRGVAVVIGGILYLAGFAALFAAPGGLGDGWLPEQWRSIALQVLAGVGYVFLGASVWHFIRGNEGSFPWAFVLIGSVWVISIVLYVGDFAASGPRGDPSDPTYGVPAGR